MEFEEVPCEVLEHIAFFLATDSFLGPPSALVPLLQLNRTTNAYLTLDSNPHLYARIFSVKFDTNSAIEYFGAHHLSATAQAIELQRRCIHLKRLRDNLDSIDPDISLMGWSSKDPEHLESVLWTTYLMMIENDGKNETQLRDYANICDWIENYWFHIDGMSLARQKLIKDLWPNDSLVGSVAMWLLWLFFRPDEYVKDIELRSNVASILKLYALAAHRYPLVNLPWTDYSVEYASAAVIISSNIIAYGESINLAPLPVGTPATLCYLSHYSKSRLYHRESSTVSSPFAAATIYTQPLRVKDSSWQRGFSYTLDPVPPISCAFQLGSMEGVWQGIFTYSEFSSYTELLRGAPPSVLSTSKVVQHGQTWKLREYVLFPATREEMEESSGTSGQNNQNNWNSLPIGDPMRSFFPDDSDVTEHSKGVVIRTSGRTVLYIRCTAIPKGEEKRVRDVIIIGEGHSSWGQFILRGRVRPYDGFVVLSKHYLDGDRGHWLYRGHVIGDHFVGRWRDTLSPVNLMGYEGGFGMDRRR